MKNLLVHGCYDRATFKTLNDLGIKEFGFDLRPKSSNLITLKELNSLLKDINVDKVFLTFENDSLNTIFSFLDLLKNSASELVLEFRDQQSVNFYYDLNRPFVWMFHPSADWRSILTLPKLKAVLLPLRWQSFYQFHPDLWNLIDQQNLKVYLHADTLQEAFDLRDTRDIFLSVDLTSEIETAYRCVDQQRLSKLKIWSSFNESSSGQ
jgi:hypothetical protein